MLPTKSPYRFNSFIGSVNSPILKKWETTLSVQQFFKLVSSAFDLLSSAVEMLTCDPPCTGNKACMNFSGDPECVCADGYSGENNCTGISDSIMCCDREYAKLCQN